MPCAAANRCGRSSCAKANKSRPHNPGRMVFTTVRGGRRVVQTGEFRREAVSIRRGGGVPRYYLNRFGTYAQFTRKASSQDAATSRPERKCASRRNAVTSSLSRRQCRDGPREERLIVEPRRYVNGRVLAARSC